MPFDIFDAILSKLFAHFSGFFLSAGVILMKSLRIHNFDSRRLKIHFSLFKILHLHELCGGNYRTPCHHHITPRRTINISAVLFCPIRFFVLRHVFLMQKHQKSIIPYKNGKTFHISVFVLFLYRYEHHCL